MFNENLLYSTKAILKYLVNRGPGYQTIYSVSFDFYCYTGHYIPYVDLGFNHLVTFLQSIPDTLDINPLTLEVYPAKISLPERDIPLFPYYQFKRQWSTSQCYNYVQTPSFMHQPRSLAWRPGNDHSKWKKKPFQPIEIKNPNSIIDKDTFSPLPLGPRTFGDGKCSSTDSVQSNCDPEFIKKTEAQDQTLTTVELPTLSNYSDDLMSGSSVEPTNDKNISDCDNNVSNYDRNNETELPTLSNYSDDLMSGSSVEPTNDKNISECENNVSDYDRNNETQLNKEVNLKLTKHLEQTNDLVVNDASSVENIPLSSSAGIMDLKNCEFEECPPPPYAEKDDQSEKFDDSYDYDLLYYLSSPEEKAPQSDDSLQSCAIPFMEDDDPIYMLDSGFSSENYGSKYETKFIDNVMEVGGFYEIYISEVNNPYKFWFQLDVEKPKSIDELQKTMNGYYNRSHYDHSPDKINTEHMKKGYACAALYNKIWHRGEMLGEPKNGFVKIFFVDYGTVDDVSVRDVRYILNIFCSAPKMCYRGTLDFIKPKSNRWDVETTTFFINLIENKKLIAGVSEINNETNSVRLYVMDREKDINVNFKLVYDGYAFPEDPRGRYQLHLADALPAFETLEKGEYPSLAEVYDLLQCKYDFEKLRESSVIDEIDFFIPQHISDEEALERKETFQKKKEEAKKLAQQRDVSVFLQFFGKVLKNPFLNGTITSQDETTNPFYD